MSLLASYSWRPETETASKMLERK